MNLKASSISLYIHIPFCSSKCKYCDFYSETAGFDRIVLVVDQIIEQLKFRYNSLGKPGIKTIFIGGGTPSIIPVTLLKKLLSYLKSLLTEDIEWSIESNPESISKEFLETCSFFGVNRLSVGVQSFNNSLLDLLGRGAKIRDIERGFKLIKESWNGEVNLDLISSIPEQTPELVKADIDMALKLQPDHISFYALSLEEGTLLEDEVSKGIVNDLPEKISEDIWFQGKKLLLDSGFKQYEVSNYTMGKPCLHNLAYWELKPYLGVGPGAVSTIINKAGCIERVTTSKSITTFIEGIDKNWGETSEVISPKEFLKDYLIMGLRLVDGVDMSRFKEIFGYEIEDIITITKDLIKSELVVIDRSRYKLTSKGYDIMNSVVIDILESIENFQIEKINWFY